MTLEEARQRLEDSPLFKLELEGKTKEEQDHLYVGVIIELTKDQQNAPPLP